MTRHERFCPECGALLGKRRSLPDHRRYFAAVKRAAAIWPHDHEFQPTGGPEHLRAYLLVTAGYHDVVPIDLSQFSAESDPSIPFRLVAATIQAITTRGDYAFTRLRGDVVEVLWPKSLNFQTLSQKDFGPIREACEEIIELALGCNVENLLRQEAA